MRSLALLALLLPLSGSPASAATPPDQPGVWLIDEAHAVVCASSDDPVCRQISGRPLFAGASDLCGPRHSDETLPGRMLRDGFDAADADLRNATSTYAAGTPLEGESICHDHWPTLRALATLP